MDDIERKTFSFEEGLPWPVMFKKEGEFPKWRNWSHLGRNSSLSLMDLLNEIAIIGWNRFVFV